MLFVEKYCRENPLSDFRAALSELVNKVDPSVRKKAYDELAASSPAIAEDITTDMTPTERSIMAIKSVETRDMLLLFEIRGNTCLIFHRPSCPGTDDVLKKLAARGCRMQQALPVRIGGRMLQRSFAQAA